MANLRGMQVEACMIELDGTLVDNMGDFDAAFAAVQPAHRPVPPAEHGGGGGGDADDDGGGGGGVTATDLAQPPPEPGPASSQTRSQSPYLHG